MLRNEFLNGKKEQCTQLAGGCEFHTCVLIMRMHTIFFDLADIKSLKESDQGTVSASYQGVLASGVLDWLCGQRICQDVKNVPKFLEGRSTRKH